MGPQLRRYLGITEDEYTGFQTPHPGDDESARFSADLMTLVVERAPADQAEFVDLLEELTSMGLSQVAVQLADSHSQFSIDSDFRACLSLGSSLMMESELEESITLLRQAHALAPMEAAPLVNLAAIHYALEQDQEAMQWAEAGLQLDPNNSRLWELLASLFLVQDKATAADKVKSKAEQFHAYAGYSLAAEVMDPNDKLLKAQLLEEAYSQGIRDDDFLIEYTAALGLAQQFEKIPQLVWRLEHMEKKPVHWKLFVHAAQAYLALDQADQAKQMIALAEHTPGVQAAIINDLKQVYDSQTMH
jgi:tetratricopeptide (TPR) repeat protein